jgi:hypothetical protein
VSTDATTSHTLVKRTRALRTRRLTGLTRHARPGWVFAALAVAATVWLLYKGRHFTFQNDEWDWLLHRRGHSLGVFLRPHLEHLSLLPVAVYKILLSVFGAGSTFPFRFVDALLATLCASLLYALLARTVGGWVALAPAAILLVLGPGWNDILWSFQIGYLTSLAAGLASLLILERPSRRRDTVAAVLLTIAVLAGSVGVIALFVALVFISFDLRATGWRRLWVIAFPAFFYALWYAKYGVSAVQLHYVDLVPLYVFNGLAAVAGSLTGLTAPDGTPYVAALDPGRAIAIMLIVGLAVRILFGSPLSSRFWSAIAFALAFWIAAALDYVLGRDANTSRYIYAVTPFVIIAIVEACRGWRLPRVRGLAVLYVGAVAAIVSNLSFLNQGADLFDVTSVYARGELAALQTARGLVSPTFFPESASAVPIIGFHSMQALDAGSYFAAVDSYGSPADTPRQLLTAPEGVREASDYVLVTAEGIRVRPSDTNAQRCPIRMPASGAIELTSNPGTTIVAPGNARVTGIRLRRFATQYRYVALTLPSPRQQAYALTLPRDRSAVPWNIEIGTRAPLRICRS